MFVWIVTAFVLGAVVAAAGMTIWYTLRLLRRHHKALTVSFRRYHKLEGEMRRQFGYIDSIRGDMISYTTRLDSFERALAAHELPIPPPPDQPNRAYFMGVSDKSLLDRPLSWEGILEDVELP